MDTLTVSLRVTHHYRSPQRDHSALGDCRRRPAGLSVARLSGDLVRVAQADTGARGAVHNHRSRSPRLRRYREAALGYDKRTMANDLAALMDHHGHKRAPIIGHDRGARVGTRFAKDHRDRIDRFAALDNVPTRILVENSSPGLNHNRLVLHFSWRS